MRRVWEKNALTDLLLSGKLILFILTPKYILFFGCVIAAMIMMTSSGWPSQKWWFEALFWFW